ncbi:HAD-like domain-containing protein [Gymnopilus junonius]|uniref:HAD-like domain-containing protein n=1 Tax=Gymnopilus junonius TaxID=109634 RepID=A0A9P5TMW6_GYMJU|nr:HAD-like domain-containing protein [Gymnopilus junonius]
MNPIRLVTFDALHTIITPRLPIYVQYSQVFEPYLGRLPPDCIKQSFNVALRSTQEKHPSYEKGAKHWWCEVIRCTALDAGANEQLLNTHLDDIVDTLMIRFSSRTGYKAFDDAIPTIRHLREKLGIRTAIISNADSRIRAVLTDLEFPDYLKPVILSEEEGIEKPSRHIFVRALGTVNREAGSTYGQIFPNQCLHVGDELTSDYNGAKASGWNALLLRRQGIEGECEHKEPDETLKNVRIINRLDAIINWIQRHGTC